MTESVVLVNVGFLPDPQSLMVFLSREQSDKQVFMNSVFSLKLHVLDMEQMFFLQGTSVVLHKLNRPPFQIVMLHLTESSRGERYEKSSVEGELSYSAGSIL